MAEGKKVWVDVLEGLAGLAIAWAQPPRPQPSFPNSASIDGEAQGDEAHERCKGLGFSHP
jgi:hypothetical protein